MKYVSLFIQNQLLKILKDKLETGELEMDDEVRELIAGFNEENRLTLLEDDASANG